MSQFTCFSLLQLLILQWQYSLQSLADNTGEDCQKSPAMGWSLFCYPLRRPAVRPARKGAKKDRENRTEQKRQNGARCDGGIVIWIGLEE